MKKTESDEDFDNFKAEFYRVLKVPEEKKILDTIPKSENQRPSKMVVLNETLLDENGYLRFKDNAEIINIPELYDYIYKDTKGYLRL